MSSVKRTIKKPPLFAVFALLSIITVCLVVLLVVIPETSDRSEPDDETASLPSEEERSDAVGGTRQTPGIDDRSDSVSGTSEDEKVAVQKPATENSGSIEPSVEFDVHLVIDDVGNNMEQFERFLGFEGTLTFAVMPKRPYSAEAVRRAVESGHDVIVHQPMEAVGGQNPGPGAIYVSMSDEEIRNTLEDNLKGLGSIVGLNNHMGSRVTADRPAMRSILTFLKEQGMFFIDSVTTDKSVAAEVAEEVDVAFARRNSAFLDNNQETEAIAALLEEGLLHAASSGSVILIGHVHSGALADILVSNYERLFDRGYRFKGIRNFIAEQDGD